MPVDTACTRRSAALGAQTQEGVHHRDFLIHFMVQYIRSFHIKYFEHWPYIKPFLSESI